MLARSIDRQGELAIRSALGASRGRVIQQLMTECLLLAFLSAAIGIVVAIGATSAIAKAEPGSLPSQTYSILDVRVVAFALAVSLGSAFLVGWMSALNLGQTHIFVARGTSEFRRSRLIREAFVIAQIVLTVVLLVASLSVGSAFSRLMQVDRGSRWRAY
jgi:NAD/NADP transhydrogenase beta subunit